jgi:hypothetical protein
MDKTDLLELAERAEKATGPDYAIDCAIWDAIYPGERQERFEKLTAKGQPYHGRLGPADVDGYVKPLRAFTASIDAAMTLAPDGWTWVLFATGGAVLDRVIPSDGENKIRTLSCATPALALCSAALKARASLSSSREE